MKIKMAMIEYETTASGDQLAAELNDILKAILETGAVPEERRPSHLQAD